LQIAEISPIVVEEPKAAEPPATTTPTTSNSRRRRRRSRRSGRNREETSALAVETASDLDELPEVEPEYSPPQIEEPVKAGETTAISPVELALEPPPVAVEFEPVPEPTPVVAEAALTEAASETPAQASRSRRRSRKTKSEAVANTAAPQIEAAGEQPTPAPAITDVVGAEPVSEMPSATTEAGSTPINTAPDEESGQVDLSFEFSEAEWELFHTTVRELGKPATFQQLLSALQTARKKHGLPRTTEENRTMLKQAIHHGMLERITRNRRVYYTLKTGE